MIQEPSFPNYYTKVSALYDGLREMQSQVFERQISSQFNNLAVMGIQLAEESDHIIASYLKENALDFEQLNGSEIRLSSLQEALFDTLEHKLLEADCTGAFILLNAQVNPSVENASVSRSGLYLQRSSLDSSDNRILLYRGLAAIGKKQGCMPHRTWRLEFRTDHVPDFEHIKEKADLPLFSSYQLTDMFTLPGTSERVMLLALPLTGSDGTFFGLCGFEISESYFKHVFAQPSSLSRALFCLCSGNDGLADTRDCFSAGIVNDYYLALSGTYHTQNFGNGLKCFQNDTSSYIGISNPVHLRPGDVPFSVSVLMPFTDYRTQAIADGLRILLLLLLSLSAAASCCLYFSHRYLIPVYQSIQRICQKEYDASDTSIAEIDDLFAFLAEQDRINEAALEKIKAENATAQASLKQLLRFAAIMKQDDVSQQKTSPEFHNFRISGLSFLYIFYFYFFRPIIFSFLTQFHKTYLTALRSSLHIRLLYQPGKLLPLV